MKKNRKAMVTGIRVELDDGRTQEIPGGEAVAIFAMDDAGDATEVNVFMHGSFDKNKLNAMASTLEKEFGSDWLKAQLVHNMGRLINSLEKCVGKEADEEQT